MLRNLRQFIYSINSFNLQSRGCKLFHTLNMQDLNLQLKRQHDQEDQESQQQDLAREALRQRLYLIPLKLETIESPQRIRSYKQNDNVIFKFQKSEIDQEENQSHNLNSKQHSEIKPELTKCASNNLVDSPSMDRKSSPLFDQIKKSPQLIKFPIRRGSQNITKEKSLDNSSIIIVQKKLYQLQVQQQHITNVKSMKSQFAKLSFQNHKQKQEGQLVLVENHKQLNKQFS